MIEMPTRGLTGWLVAGALAYSAVIGGSGYLKGRADGRSKLVEQLQEGRVTILKDGKEIDYAVLAADDDGLCALLGGCQLHEHPGRD